MEKPAPFKQSRFAVLVKRTASIVFLSTFCLNAFAQTDNISGVVNSYYQVIEVIPAKAGVRLNTTAGLVHGNLTMLVQMKGAAITTATGATFGDTISLNNAGYYEIATVCAVIDDTVFFFHNLINNYSVDSKVQLVKFSEHVSADVVDTVKAAPWDSVSGTGGVIAIRCDQDLTLTRPIFADSGGYRGGIWFDHSGNCPVGTNFAYDATNFGSAANGAYKGEGVSVIPGTLDGGKGAPANGGGGGNNHNNSGAGGANLTSGGNGGGNSSNGPFGCNTANNYGRAGKALSSWGGKKIFMGGGGGAGHSNNATASFTYGGNGGGLIFIWAENLNGNSELITANGGNGGASQSDGAGGGGAGGTIIMHVTNYTGSATIRANGGNGGLSDNGTVGGRCFGGGGGGSGGAIYFTGAIPPVTVTTTGGVFGNEINRDAACNAAVPGASGSNGSVFSSYAFTRSTDPAGYCALLLPSKLLSFKTLLGDKKVQLSWQVLQPELVQEFIIERKTATGQWVMISRLSAADPQQHYSSTDNEPLPGINFYRLRVTEKSNSFYYSAVRQVRVDFSGNPFTVYPNPAITQITIRRHTAGTTLFRLSDVNGKLVLQTQLLNTVTTLPLPKLAAGIYLAEINGAVQKLMIR